MLELGLATNLQNEQSYLSRGYFSESPSDAQVSGRKCETGNEIQVSKRSLEREKHTLNGNK